MKPETQGECHVMTRVDTGVTPCHPRNAETTRGQEEEEGSLFHLQREDSPANTLVWDVSLQNWDTIIFCYFPFIPFDILHKNSPRKLIKPFVIFHIGKE